MRSVSTQAHNDIPAKKRRTQLGLVGAVPELARQPEILSLSTGAGEPITDTLSAFDLVLINLREI